MSDVFVSNVLKIHQIIPNSVCIHVYYIPVRSENMMKISVCSCSAIDDKWTKEWDELCQKTLIFQKPNREREKKNKQTNLWANVNTMCKINVEMGTKWEKYWNEMNAKRLCMRGMGSNVDVILQMEWAILYIMKSIAHENHKYLLK